MPSKAYRNAQRSAAQYTDRVAADAVAKVASEVDAWARELARLVAQAPDARTRSELSMLLSAVRQTTRTMTNRLITMTEEGSTVTYKKVAELWNDALQRKLAESGRVAFSATASPHVVEALTFASGHDYEFKTLISGYGSAAYTEVEGIITRGILRGASPESLGRALYAYIRDNDGNAFRNLATKTRDGKLTLDLSRVPDRGSAAQIRYRAQRIAYTEITRAEYKAAVQHFKADPYIIAIKRTLAPNRGGGGRKGKKGGKRSDVCDVLVNADIYGMGQGIYPLDKAPGLGHPWCRCQNEPVEASEPVTRKPSPRRTKGWQDDLDIPEGSDAFMRYTQKRAIDLVTTETL